MIDTDKYEKIHNDKDNYLSNYAVTQLIKEVRRLREGIKFFLDIDKQPSRAELLELIK